MPLTQHLSELRTRFIICFATIVILSCVSFTFYNQLSTFLLAPFSDILTTGATINVSTIYEGFFVKIKVAILGGVVGSLPIIVYQLCRYIIPGLKAAEKKWLFVIIVTSSLLAITSTYVGYGVVLPYVVTFLLNEQFIPDNINILLNYRQNLNYIMSFLIGSIIVFQSPIVLAVCLANNIITRRFLLQNARWFIIGILITSAMVTPPDIFSQLSLSLPLIIFYFCCILMAKLFGWGND